MWRSEFGERKKRNMNMGGDLLGNDVNILIVYLAGKTKTTTTTTTNKKLFILHSTNVIISSVNFFGLSALASPGNFYKSTKTILHFSSNVTTFIREFRRSSSDFHHLLDSLSRILYKKLINYCILLTLIWEVLCWMNIVMTKYFYKNEIEIL